MLTIVTRLAFGVGPRMESMPWHSGFVDRYPMQWNTFVKFHLFAPFLHRIVPPVFRLSRIPSEWDTFGGVHLFVPFPSIILQWRDGFRTTNATIVGTMIRTSTAGDRGSKRYCNRSESPDVEERETDFM